MAKKFETEEERRRREDIEKKFNLPKEELPMSIDESKTPKALADKRKKQREEGQAFIRAREKARSKGLSKGEAVRAAVSGETAQQAGAVVSLPDTAQPVAPILEQAGAFEQVTPKEVSLQPSTTDIPILGSTLGALHSALIEGNFLGFRGAKDDEEIPITAGSVREIALQRIREKRYQEGLTAAESFGSFVESIPIIGSLVSKYARGVIETPNANAKNVLNEINKIKEAASTGQEKVRNGLEDPDYGLDRARQMEENLAELEGRLKLLINSSPILRANTDEINTLQEAILESREKVARYRRASTYGLTAEVTGTGRAIPSDEAIYRELLAMRAS